MSRSLISSSVLAGAVLLVGFGCARTDTAPAVATVSFAAAKERVPLGSPVVLTYRFEVAPDSSMPEDFRVFVHVTDDSGHEMWNDDHDPPVPTGEWRPGQPIEYSRTVFVPVFPYVGKATVEVGLYRGNDRLKLQAARAPDQQPATRSYPVGTIELAPQSEGIFLIYKSGWHPAEFAPDNPTLEWQWTQKLATLTLRNPRADVTFYLQYDARPDLFLDAPQVVTVSAGGEVVDSFPADQTLPTLRQITIPAARFGSADMAELRIEVDRTFVPAKLPGGGRDGRELGIRVYHAYVEAR